MNDLKIVEEPKVLTESQNTKELALSYLKSMGLNIPEQFQTQFIEIAAAMKLNPFLNEIHAISYNTKDGPVFKCVTGYMVYIKRAERSGKLNGWEVSSTVNGQMVSTVTIYRKDWEKPFRHSVRFSEVAQYSPSGELSRLWKKMPAFMCEKACISQAFRLCFPDELAGMPYTTEEMPEGVMLGTAQPIQPEKQNFVPETPEQKTIPIQTPEQMGMQRASQLPRMQLKGGESTDTEKKEIKALFAIKYANGVPVFTLEEMKTLSAMRAEQYTAQEFIVFLKQELSRRLGL
jgi:phage recombination protein Bet